MLDHPALADEVGHKEQLSKSLCALADEGGQLGFADVAHTPKMIRSLFAIAGGGNTLGFAEQ